jgi:hypothetical protein
MPDQHVTVTPRTVRHVAIATGLPYEEFRAEYETAVPAFDRLEAIGEVASGAGWPAIESPSRNTAGDQLPSRGRTSAGVSGGSDVVADHPREAQHAAGPDYLRVGHIAATASAGRPGTR